MIAFGIGYYRTKKFQLALKAAELQTRSIVLQLVSTASARRDQSDQQKQGLEGLDSSRKNDALQAVLVNHIWNLCGDMDSNREDSFN